MATRDVLGYRMVSSCIHQIKEHGYREFYEPLEVKYKISNPRLFSIPKEFNARLKGNYENYILFLVKGFPFAFRCDLNEDDIRANIDNKKYSMLLNYSKLDNPLLLNNMTVDLFFKSRVSSGTAQKMLKEVIGLCKGRKDTVANALYDSFLMASYPVVSNLLEDYSYKQRECGSFRYIDVTTKMDEEDIEDIDPRSYLSFYLHLLELLMTISGGKYSYYLKCKDLVNYRIKIGTDRYLFIPASEDASDNTSIFHVIKAVNKICSI